MFDGVVFTTCCRTFQRQMNDGSLRARLDLLSHWGSGVPGNCQGGWGPCGGPNFFSEKAISWLLCFWFFAWLSLDIFLKI